MSKRSIYICEENMYGNDPCESDGNEISDIDNEISFDMDGTPRCPKKTRSGKDCGGKLRFIRTIDPLGKRALIGGCVLAALVLIAFAGYWMMGGEGEPLMKVEPATLIFPRAEAGTASANLRVRNNGDGELIIERIEANPSVFSTSKDEMQVEPNDAATLFVHFKSPSTEKMEGELLLYSNAPGSPSAIRLVANHDPWSVYQKLETSSKILSTEP
ncbi:MAG: DUF1573 domain-containing protein [bacterium]|nr:DUF1573 domain-containing protein [bacterium]